MEENRREEIGPVDEWIEDQDFNTTDEVHIPELMADQVIGQDEAVHVIKKAAAQKRHVMLIGEPGTGKSMLANSMVEFLPQGELQDVISYHNPEDYNEPRIRVLPAGKGRPIVNEQKALAAEAKRQKNSSFLFLVFGVVMLGVVYYLFTRDSMLLWISILVAFFLYLVMRNPNNQRQEIIIVPKLLIGHEANEKPPFVDATGSHSGSLLGDVRHDPFQSGGLETPSHDRLEVGAIHKANKGVLFIDEINMLRMESQQAILTAMQEKRLSITGQSERSSGALVKSEPVPTDFVLVCAGNLDALEGMHPALRSRIRGYGYEVYMKNTMEDTDENRKNIIRFVAQEVRKDGKIPAFSKYAVAEIIREAQRRAGSKGKLTLRFRELGGLVRVAGDVAVARSAKVVTREDVEIARNTAKSLENQIADRVVESHKNYNLFKSEGSSVGMINGLAALNGSSSMSEFAGVVLPIVAEVAPSQTKKGGKIIATGKLGEIAKESVENISAVIKKYTMTDITDSDIHIQFIGTYEGVEGDSASITITTAVISAMEGIPIDQTMAMTGSLNVRGKVLPVGGITAKLEAAAEAGMKRAIIPKENEKDVMIQARYYDRMEIILVENLRDVLEYALKDGDKKDQYLKKLLPLTENGKSTARKLVPPAISEDRIRVKGVPSVHTENMISQTSSEEVPVMKSDKVKDPGPAPL
ncbi:MAG: ATP-dependent protease LonB [Candidatus Methanomethylophilaceae archaeon]|jgi:Lon-like ATP-dependent protease|nr:ATP-dependent protease LonB [Candidatus Methanomethylophilaceae archaeon]MDD4119732.1 ATP-dependent protease LonB [Candidatus Methanomethylophilaceae archaeon]